MQLVTFEHENIRQIGALLAGNRVLPLKSAAEAAPERLRQGFPADFPADLGALLRLGEGTLDRVRELLDIEPDLEPLPLSAVRLLAPVPRPSKIVCIGLNYMDHCREQKIQPPEAPIIFAKFPTSVIGPGDTITWDPALTSQVDYEAELAVVIGRRAKGVPASRASDYIAGYTALNDVSARDLQFGDGQWIRGKSLDTFCPMGPALVTKDEVPDPQALTIKCQVNEALLQDSTTAEMIFKIPELIEFITRGITLQPGDVIATGTPDGVGVFRDPQVFLQGGEQVTVTIEKVGRLVNRTALIG